MEMVLRALIVLALTSGTLCQEIRLENPTVLTPCSRKSRSGRDKFLMKGTIGPDVPKLIAEGWHPSMSLLAFDLNPKNYYDYDYLCRIVLKGGNICNSDYPEVCTCAYKNKQVLLDVNYTLAAYHSRKSVGVKWNHKTIEYKRVLSNNYSLPEICDVNTAHLTLTIAGTVISLPTSRSCSFTMTLDTSNIMQLCCSNAALPCYTQISFRGAVVATNESPCVTYGPTVHAVTGSLQLSYSVCSTTEYRQGRNCTIMRGYVSTRVPPSTTVAATRAPPPTTAVVITGAPPPTTDVAIPEFTEPTSGVVIPEFTEPTPACDSTQAPITPVIGVVIPEFTEPTPDVKTPKYSEPTSVRYAPRTKAPTTVQPSPEKSNTFKRLVLAALLLVLLIVICGLMTLWIIKRNKKQDEVRQSKRESVRRSLSDDSEVAPRVEVEESASTESASADSQLESEV